MPRRHAPVIDEDRALRLLQELVRTPSVNPPGAERACGEILATELSRAGVDMRIETFDDDRCNVVARIRGNGIEPALLLSGHLDTVPPGERGWERDPLSGAIEGDRLYGLGSADMKGGVAAMALGMIAVLESGAALKGDLVLAATAGEETDSIGARKFMESLDFEGIGAVIVTEPTSLNIRVAEKGALWLEFVIEGLTSHGSRPELGVNAIQHANVVLDRIIESEFPASAHPLLTPPTLSVNTIRGGVKTNVVPDRCVFTVDIRTVPGQSHEEIVGEFESMLDELGAELPGFSGQIFVTNNRPPVETDPQDRLVTMARTVAGEILQRDIIVNGQQPFTDASVYVERGIPQIILGPGPEDLCHQPNEWTSISQYLSSVKILYELARRYLGAPTT